jgi:hypothetical protein
MTQREVRDDTAAQYHRGGCGAAPSNRSGDQQISSKGGLATGFTARLALEWAFYGPP